MSPRANIINPDAPRADLLARQPTALQRQFHEFIEDQTGVKVPVRDVVIILSLRKSFADTPEQKERLAKRKEILAAEKAAREKVEAKWAKSATQTRREAAEAEPEEPAESGNDLDDEGDDEERASSGKSAAVLDEEEDEDEEEEEEEEEEEKPAAKPGRAPASRPATSKSKAATASRKPAPY